MPCSLPSPFGLLQAVAQIGQLHPSPRRFGDALHQLLEQHQRLGGVLLLAQGGGLLAAVMRQPQLKAAAAGVFQQLGHGSGLLPVARAFVNGQPRQPGIGLQRRAFEPQQRRLGPIEQARFQKILGQRMACARALVCRQVGTRQQVFVHPHGAVVITAAAKQIAERKMQLGGVGVVLHGLDEGIDGLVVLLVEQVVQAAKVGLGCAPVFQPQLAQIEARRQPAQRKRGGQAPEQADQVKFHEGAVRRHWLWFRAD